ncbi:kinesin-like protein KIF23, partial [Leptotrombidium deliense]
RTKTPKKPPPTKPKPGLNSAKDPVEVFCRLRPNVNVADLICVRRFNDYTVQLRPPSGPRSEIYYTFKYVFPETASQKTLFENIAKPLVSDLLAGKNGLLFTYGITSSGKTYTVTGNPQNNGILPRCLDVLFNSITYNQSRKYVFKPDGLNGFEIQSIPDALLELQKEKQYPKTPTSSARTPKIRKKENDENKEWEKREKENDVLELVNVNNSYAVFISYVEIYNNYVYDLLDDSMGDQLKLRQMQPQSKALREDNRKRVFVAGGTEIEVKNADDAFEMFMKGVRRRRIAHTALNAESSRSHSVFTIKVVQALHDSNKEVIMDQRFMCVSQLSLVDLAGSERTMRTQNTGERLREAGNINNSLMALRNCIEILRENQKSNSNKIVPYRDNKLTHLFKSYFEGEGKIRMIICVNTGTDDFDETMHVMKFAETTQEVMVTRAADPLRPMFEAMNEGERFSNLPSALLLDPCDDKVFPEWIEFFTERKRNRERKLYALSEAGIVIFFVMFTKDLITEARFRSQLADMESENMFLKQRVTSIEADLEVRENQVKVLESKCNFAERHSETCSKKADEVDKKLRYLERELGERDRLLNINEMEKERLRSRAREELEFEKERRNRLFERLLAEKQAQLETQKCITEEKMNLVREILSADNNDWEVLKDYREGIYPNLVSQATNAASIPPTPDARTPSTISATTAAKRRSEADIQSPIPRRAMTEAALETATAHTPVGSNAPPVVNPRHRRSLSTGTEKWIDHRPPGTLDLGTVLQPKIKNKKSVSNLKNFGTDNFKNCSKYALTHHVADNDGEVETFVYKGEVIPSVAGGTQVIFQDVESLKQNSPPTRFVNLITAFHY